MQNTTILTSITIHPVYSSYGCDRFGNVYRLNKDGARNLSVEVLHGGHSRITLCRNGKKQRMLVHRFVYECETGKILSKKQELDHKDRQPDNNSFDNLRLADKSLNAANCVKRNGNYSSKFKGVSWNSKLNRWIAYLRINGRFIYGGRFENEIDAAQCYNRLATEYFGSYACLNEVKNVS